MKRRVFKNYQEYYSLTKPLSEHQKQLLFSSLSPGEQAFLEKACRSEGWEDLCTINKVDKIIDDIKEEFGQDLVLLRIQVLSGKTKKVNRHFWEGVNNILKHYPCRLTWHILEGISTVDAGSDSVILISSRRNLNG